MIFFRDKEKQQQKEREKEENSTGRRDHQTDNGKIFRVPHKTRLYLFDTRAWI